MELTNWEKQIIEVALEQLEKRWAKSSAALQIPKKTTGQVHLEQLIWDVKNADSISIGE